MRISKRTALIAGGVVLALAAVGSMSGTDPSPSAESPSELAVASTPTPQTTTPPTPDPTPEPTDEPVNPGLIDFLLFTGHVGEATTEISDSMTKIGEGDIAEVYVLGALVKAERQWLVNNPPAECYADLQATYADALRSFARGLEAFDELDVDRMVALFNDGTESISKATDMIEVASVACS